MLSDKLKKYASIESDEVSLFKFLNTKIGNTIQRLMPIPPQLSSSVPNWRWSCSSKLTPETEDDVLTLAVPPVPEKHSESTNEELFFPLTE